MGNTETDISKLVDHLFRHESGKLVAVMTRIFGATNLDLAEDVVQDALLDAVNQWKYRGIPANPVAWLYKVARYKAINIVNREKYQRQYAAELLHTLSSEPAGEPGQDPLFSAQEILDDQVRMMFTCCHRPEFKRSPGNSPC